MSRRIRNPIHEDYGVPVRRRKRRSPDYGSPAFGVQSFSIDTPYDPYADYGATANEYRGREFEDNIPDTVQDLTTEDFRTGMETLEVRRWVRPGCTLKSGLSRQWHEDW